MKIALIAGHDSYFKQGAVASGISENVFWNELLEEIIDILPSKHKYKIFHRPNQSVYGYRGAVSRLHKDIDHWGAQVDIEFHFNAAASKASGHEVLYYKHSRSGKALATILNDSFTKFLNNPNRGIKPVGRNDRGGYQLAIGRSVSLLPEPFFGTTEIQDFLKVGGKRHLLIDSIISFLEAI